MTWDEINWTELGPFGWLELVILGNELSAWLFALGLTLVIMFALPAIKAQIRRRLQARAAQQDAVISRFAVEIVSGTRRSIIFLVAIFVGARALDLPAKIDATLTTVTAVALLIQTTLWALEAFNVWVTRYEQNARDRNAGDATIVGLISFVGRTAICAIALLMILDNLGFNITTLVASLGIGGIAIALAVQNVLQICLPHCRSAWTNPSWWAISSSSMT